MTYNFGINQKTALPTAKPTTKASKYNFGISKAPVVPTKTTVPTIQAKQGEVVNQTLPAFLGGGTYQMKVGDPNALIKSQRTDYGGLPTKQGFERADIFPVSLGGVNTSSSNITYEKNLPEFDKGTDTKYRTATDKYLMEEILPKYKSGKMSLREAQVKSVSYLRNEQEGLHKEMKNQNLGGFFGAFADDFIGTANKIGTFLGKKTGQIAEKVVNKIQGKEEKKSMTFPVGAGLPPKQAETAKQVIKNQITKSAEEKANPLNAKNPAEIAKEKIVSLNQDRLAYKAVNKTLTPDQQFQRSNPTIVNLAKTASEVLGREVKPENYVNESKNFKPEERLIINAKNDEKLANLNAQVLTSPIRFTIGAIARDYAMTEDELKKSNEKFIPKSDIQKLIYGEEPIEAISKSEDLYGTIARNVGVPAAIGAMILLDLDIVNPTGLIKKAIEEKVAKEGIERVAKMGSDEYIKMVDDIIQSEKNSGKITDEQIAQATAKAQEGVKEIKNGNPVEVITPNVKTETSQGVKQEVKQENKYNFGVNRKEQVDEIKTPVITETKKEVSLPKKEVKEQPVQSIVEPQEARGEVNIQKTTTKTQEVTEATTEPIIQEPKKFKTAEDYVKAEEIPTESIPTVTKVKKEPIKYIPEVKGPDLRKKITVTRTIGQSKLARGVQEKAIEKKLLSGFENVPDYDKINIKEQASKAIDLIDNNPELAKDIMRGKVDAPNGVLPESIFTALEERAYKDGDADMIKFLSTESTLSNEASLMGQRIRMLAERNQNSPVKKIEEIVKSRKKTIESKLAGKTEKQVKSEIKNKITKTIKNSEPKIKDWTAFIDSIKC